MTTSPRIHYQQGDHVCALYTTRDEQLFAAAEYIRAGLARGERCLYVVYEHSPDEFRAGLRSVGIDVDAEEARGALLLITKHEGHLHGGTFDPDKMISMLHGAVKDALNAGFAGLAAAGDMSWLLDGAEGSERVAEYEARLNEFYPSSRALGLCLYNRTKLPPASIDHGIATHPHIRIDGDILLRNPFYEEPAKAAVRRSDSSAFGRKLEWLRGTVAAFLPPGSRPAPPRVDARR